MSEKELLKKSGYWTIFALFLASLFWFLFSIQPCSAGYTGGPQSGIDVGINSRSTSRTNLQPGNSGVYVIRLGIENVTGIGTATGYMNGTDTYYPRIEWTPTLGTFNFVGTGSYPVTLQMNGVNISSEGSLSAKLDAINGVGTQNTFNDPTIAGVGTFTASFSVNGLVITPDEYASVNNATGELQSQIDTINTSKLSKINDVDTYIGSISTGNKIGTSSFALYAGDNISINAEVSPDGKLEATVTASGSLTTTFASLGGLPGDNAALSTLIPFTRSGTTISQGTITDVIAFGTTTAYPNTNATIIGSGTNPLYVAITRGVTATDTTAIMSGTSTPSPNIVTATSADNGNGYYAYKAFDNNVADPNRWVSENGVTNASITFDFGTGTTKIINRIDLTSWNTTMAPTDFTINASTDNVNYVTLKTVAGETSWSSLAYNTYTFDNLASYQFYKISVTAVNGGTRIDLSEIRLIDRDAPYPVIFINSNGQLLIGTTTINSTSTAYTIQVDGGLLCKNLGVTCYGSIKSIIGSGTEVIKKGYDAIMQTHLFTSHPRIRSDITIAQAVDAAKNEYVSAFQQKDYETFMDRLENYITYDAIGSSTVNWEKFQKDFKAICVEPRNDEFYALADVQNRIKIKKNEMEFDMMQTNISPISDDPSTPDIFKRSDKRILDLENQIGCLIGSVQYQDAEIKLLENLIGNLTSELETLKNK